jgi:hypothetical protein
MAEESGVVFFRRKASARSFADAQDDIKTRFFAGAQDDKQNQILPHFAPQDDKHFAQDDNLVSF